MKVDKEKGGQLELNADDYQDILRIVTKAGPKDKHKIELTSLEQILSAWNGKRELFAEMREISLITNGMVGVFKEHEIFSFLDNWKYGTEEQDCRTVYKIDVSDFLKLGKKNDLSIGVLELGRDERKRSELHIISPSMTDETGIRHRRDDFVCLKIEKKATVQEHA